MTWFDGHPAHLWQYSATEEGKSYVEGMGGPDPLCDKAMEFISRGNGRFAATLLAHAIAANPDDSNARAKPLSYFSVRESGFWWR